MNPSAGLAGVPVAVFGVGARCGSDLALGLADLGAPVAVMSGAGSTAEFGVAERVAAAVISAGGTATAARYDPLSASSIAGAIGSAAGVVGDVRAIVDVADPGAAGSPAALADMDACGWDERVTQPLRFALHRLQGSYRALRIVGGRMVVVLPSLSMSGASGMVPWTTVSEGQRALAKVAARAWGAEGITVNCVGVPAHMLAHPDREEASLDRPGLPGPSLGRPPEARSEVAVAVAALLGSGMPFVTGATLAVDGGVWMTP